MKKTLLTLAIITALSACSDKAETPKTETQPAASATTVAPASAATETASTQSVVLNTSNAPEDEKSDIHTLATILEKISTLEQKEQEWEARLATAQKNDAVQAIFKEQVEIYQNIEHELTTLKTKSVKGQQFQAKWLSAVTILRGEIQKMQQLNFEKTADQKTVAETIVPNIQKYNLAFLTSIEEYMQWVESHATDEQKAEMKDDMQEFQKIMDETKKDITSEQK